MARHDDEDLWHWGDMPPKASAWRQMHDVHGGRTASAVLDIAVTVGPCNGECLAVLRDGGAQAVAVGVWSARPPVVPPRGPGRVSMGPVAFAVRDHGGVRVCAPGGEIVHPEHARRGELRVWQCHDLGEAAPQHPCQRPKEDALATPGGLIPEP